MKPFCAAIDWGTSRFRLWLIAGDGSVLAHAQTDQGMTTAIKSGFETIIEQHLQQLKCPASLPVVICGMAGARQGWVEAKYLDAPVDLRNVLSNAVIVPHHDREIRILPGIAQRDPKSPDVMRGEETQLLGLIVDDKNPPTGQLICMPGTHSKWVELERQNLTRFATYMTGELYAAISSRTVLSMSLDPDGIIDPENEIFLKNVTRSLESPQSLNRSLFSLRSSQLLGYAAPLGGKAALSGTLIGMELAGARNQFGNLDTVTLIATGRLGDLYESALNSVGTSVKRTDGELAGLNGLVVAAKKFWGAGSASYDLRASES